MIKFFKKIFNFGNKTSNFDENLQKGGDNSETVLGATVDVVFRGDEECILAKVEEKVEIKSGGGEISDLRDEILGTGDELRDNYVFETVAEYTNRKKASRDRVVRNIKEVVKRRGTLNDRFMLEKYGIVVKKRGGFMYPNFMSANFGGFMIGKNVEDGRYVIFAGVTDVNRREFQLKGRKLTYSRILSHISDGKIHHGYKWYRVRDDGILREILGSGDFYDNESRVWLEDYFNYNEYVRKYREEHPDEKFEIDEIEVS